MRTIFSVYIATLKSSGLLPTISRGVLCKDLCAYSFTAFFTSTLETVWLLTNMQTL